MSVRRGVIYECDGNDEQRRVREGPREVEMGYVGGVIDKEVCGYAVTRVG